MTSQLPPNLLRLFAPRPPIPYIPPTDVKKKDGNTHPKYTGIAALLASDVFKDHNKDYVPTETYGQRRKRIASEKAAKAAEAVQEGLKSWDPHSDKYATDDPYKTLVVARLSYETTEKKLARTFEEFGSVKNIRLMLDKKGKSRGYAFVEFSKESDMKRAYREADGMRIDGRRVLVDVERGRTVKDWKPRRLGGGLGGTRIGYKWENKTGSGREGEAQQQSNYSSGSYSKDDRSFRDRDRRNDSFSRRDDYSDRRGYRSGGHYDRPRHRSRSPPRRESRDYYHQSSRYR